MNQVNAEHLNEAVLDVIWPGPGAVKRQPGSLGCGLVHGRRRWDGLAIRELVRRGANPNLQVSDNDALLDLALYEQDVETVCFLLERPDQHETTRADAAAVSHVERADPRWQANVRRLSRLDTVVDHLLRHGISDQRPTGSQQPGDVFTQLVEALLRAEVVVDWRDAYGWTPLMKAVAAQHHGATAALIAAGAEVEVTAKDGETLVGLARSRPDASFVDYLRDLGISGLVDDELRRARKEEDELLSALIEGLMVPGAWLHKTDYGYRDESADYRFYWSPQEQAWHETALSRTRTVTLKGPRDVLSFLIDQGYSYPKKRSEIRHLQQLITDLRSA